MNNVTNVNSTITLGQVQAALELKSQSLLSQWKIEHENLRMSLYGYDSKLVRIITELPIVDTLKKNQVAALGVFGFHKNDISIHFNLNRYSSLCPTIPSDFIDYLTDKVDIKRREFRVSLSGYLSTKNQNSDNRVSFNYRSTIFVKASLVKDILLKWQDGIVEYMENEERFKKLNLFINNINQESQLVLLNLQNPEAHKNLIEYTDSYISDRLELTKHN